MVEDKISLSATLKLANTGQASAARGLRHVVGTMRAKLTFQEFAVFGGLMFAYFLSSKSYQALVTPYRDLWPADFKLIAVLLIMSPAFLLAVRAVSGEKPGSVSRRAGLWMLVAAEVLFIAGTSVVGYWGAPPQSLYDLRAVGWAAVWMMAPFLIIEVPRAIARVRSPRAVILATPGSVGRLRRDAASLADAFDAGNVYGLGETAAFADAGVKGGLDDLIAFGRSLSTQVEFVQRAWINNADFPHVGAGKDLLLSRFVQPRLVAGGFYFVPPLSRSSQPWSWVI